MELLLLPRSICLLLLVRIYSSLVQTANIAEINALPGQVIAGTFCDRIGYSVLMVASGLGSAVAAYVLWGFAHNAALIYLFVIVFGALVSPSWLLCSFSVYLTKQH